MIHTPFENMGKLQAKIKKLGFDASSKAKLNIKEIHTGMLWTVDFTIHELMSLNPKAPNMAIPMPDFDKVYAHDVIIDEHGKIEIHTSLTESELIEVLLQKTKNRMIKKARMKNDMDDGN